MCGGTRWEEEQVPGLDDLVVPSRIWMWTYQLTFCVELRELSKLWVKRSFLDVAQEREKGLKGGRQITRKLELIVVKVETPGLIPFH